MDSSAWIALSLSLKVAGWATAIDLVLGVACGWLLARKRFPGRDLLDAVLTLPMVLPPTVLGYYLLVLIGRRGWENEQVIDLLERCPALKDCVEEHSGLPDREVQAMIAGARALLLPSFAEGYGMPVTEALALGVPVLCSDLPALREAGGAVPLFLDPLDGPAWQRAIDGLAAPDSPEYAAQRGRLARWHAPTWPEHIAIVLELLHKLAA